MKAYFQAVIVLSFEVRTLYLGFVWLLAKQFPGKEFQFEPGPSGGKSASNQRMILMFALCFWEFGL